MIRMAREKRAFLILRFSVKALAKANRRNKEARIKVGMAKPYFAKMSFTSSVTADAILDIMLRSIPNPETLKI
jgi:hypothetical protein